MPVRLKTRYHGSRDNAESQTFLRFAVDAGQFIEMARCLKLAKKQCILLVKWEGVEMQELGIFLYNGQVQRPDGDFTVGFRTDLVSVHDDVLSAMKRTCAGTDENHQQVFDLVVLTREEVEQQIADSATQGGVQADVQQQVSV